MVDFDNIDVSTAPVAKGRYDRETSLELSKFSRSNVNIIIPFRNEFDKVAKCIESIFFLTRSNPYQVCLVDDGSDDRNFFVEIQKTPWAKGSKNFSPMLVVYRNEETKGFGAACELGYKNTQQPWVVFMHSDVIVESPNWLIEMGRMLLEYKDFNIRMVAPRTNNPGEGCKDLLGEKGVEGKDLVLSKDEWLPLYCAMCHRDLFKHIGGFIKNYPFRSYEDRELAIRMQHYGFKQGVCGKSWVHHDGGGTMNKLLGKTIWKNDNPIKVDRVIENNKLMFERDVKQFK